MIVRCIVHGTRAGGRRVSTARTVVSTRMVVSAIHSRCTEAHIGSVDHSDNMGTLDIMTSGVRVQNVSVR